MDVAEKIHIEKITGIKKVKTKKINKIGRINNWQLYSMCSLPLLFIIVFNYLPMAGIVLAFKDYRYEKGIFGSAWVGLKYFDFFVNSNEFMLITWNTLYLNLLFIIVGTAAAVIVALLIFEIKSRTAVKIIQTTIITPHFLSWVVVGYMSYAFLNPKFGLLNMLLSSFGIEPVNWYSTPDAWPAILTIVSTWKNVGLDSIIYYAALMSIDTSYFEAAALDGAGKLKIIRYIILPFLVPLLTMLTILKIGGIFRADFGLFYQLTRDMGQLYSRTDVIDTYLYRTMRVMNDMSLSTAIGLLQSVVGFVLVIITNYISKKIDTENGLF